MGKASRKKAERRKQQVALKAELKALGLQGMRPLTTREMELVRAQQAKQK